MFDEFVDRIIEQSELKAVTKTEFGKITEDSDHWPFYPIAYQ